MDSDSTDDTSSDYSTESSEDDGMETAEVNGTRLQLPAGLCEHRDIFMHVLSGETFASLSDAHQRHLAQFLPTFPANDPAEKADTLARLFGGETFRFNSPLVKFHDDLNRGYFRPEIAAMRRVIRRAERKEAAYRYERGRQKLKLEVVAAQARLLDQVRRLPPGVEPRTERAADPGANFTLHRTKRRYFQILSAIEGKTQDGYASPDENYPEGPPVGLSRKQRRHLNSIRNSYAANSEIFHSTIRPSHHSALASKQSGLDLEKYITPHRNPFYVNDEAYRTLLTSHKRRKLDNLDAPDYNTSGITIEGVVTRTQLPFIKNLTVKVETKPIKKKIKKRIVHQPQTSNSELETDSDSFIDITTPKMVKKLSPILAPSIATPPPPPPPPIVKIEEVQPELVKIEQPVEIFEPKPVTIADLEGIDVMDIPIDLETAEIDILGLNSKPELMQETHSNFFSLIRDVICSNGDHRMQLNELEGRLRAWQDNPISPLNDWYHLHDWVELMRSALDFLSGCGPQPDDFVPYIEHKAGELCQWIGAGRDSDVSLALWCRHWLENRCEGKASPVAVEQREEEVEVSDRAQTPPPPRCPTNWTVRKAGGDEVRSFREQERKRYDNPHKAFTYRCNGYESVVGPLKGIYNAAVGANTKARGHTMLNADRPNFVTILSLVRDATARLPNGEGTRADICELLKRSQYISSTAPDNVLQTVVSGALDRMHTQFDPCVKYDPKRKIWIYLHRNRSEEDFERIHQQYQGVARGPKKVVKKAKPRARSKSEKIPVKTGKSEPQQQQTVLKPVVSNSLLISNQEKVSAEEKEINEALQAIVQNRIATSPTASKSGKSFVKIIAPNQGKSLIIPQSNAQIIKNEAISQQLLQNFKQKQLQVKQDDEKIEQQQPKPQFIQSITPQQLQNIKNVTLVRNLSQTSGELKLGPLSEQIQIKSQTALTPAQQAQILQTIKQKMLPQGGVGNSVLNSQVQNQQLLKQKAAMQKQAILGQQAAKLSLESKNQNPVVAKVLTNAAGQVISVESLLAHQKQHGSLPHGTTLRVSGTKSGQPSIIQLTGASTQKNQIAQFAVASQNNIIITSQPKLVVATAPTSITTSPAPSAPKPRSLINKPQPTTIAASKFPPKIAQQLINAKLIATAPTGGVDGTKQKLYINPTSSQMKLATSGVKSVTKPMQISSAGNSTIRMVNAANLNITHIGGKPVLLASKGTTIQNLQGQNVILQTQAGSGSGTGTSSLVLQNQKANLSLIGQPNVVQMKVPQQMVLKSAQTGGHVMLDGHPVRLQTTGAGGGQRVVLASQGQGGQIVAQQILLPAGFQGTAINIKALQGVKVIPLAQAGQARGVGRQMFARVMSPVVKAAAGGSADKADSDTTIITTSD